MKDITHKNLTFEMFGKTGPIVGDGAISFEEPNEISLFLNQFFGRKRLLIIRVEGNKRTVEKALSDYCLANNLEKTLIDGRTLTKEIIKGEVETYYENGCPYSRQKKPEYIADKNQMIIVRNLNDGVDIEVIRAFCYMGFLGSYYDDVENLPDDKLPYGSTYVFLAGKRFPFNEFGSISSHWGDESAILDMRSFQTKVKDHMDRYKVSALKINEKGTFMYKVTESNYGHILPIDKKEFNILPKYRSDFFSSNFYEPSSLHKYFHHLNSSQAMCINFFYPLIVEKQLELMLTILMISGTPDYDNVGFEKISDKEEISDRNTNFDFFIQSTEGIKIYFEIKYTEAEFGEAEKDSSHKDKYKKIYEPMLINNPAINDSVKTEDFFLDNYQVMRNLIHIDTDSYVVFLYPENNKSIRDGALSAKNKIIEPQWREHFILFTWEDLIDQVQLGTNSPVLIEYYRNEFSLKYLKL